MVATASQATWDAALAAYRGAEKACADHSDLISKTVLEGRMKITDPEWFALVQEDDRLYLSVSEPEIALFNTAAPDLAAVIVKLEVLWQDQRDAIPEFNALVLADVKRLAGEA